MVFEFVEVVFVFFEFFVELKFLEFGFFYLIGEFLDLRGLEGKLFFDIFLLLDFFSVVFEFSFEGINFGDELGFFVVGQSLIFLFKEDFFLFFKDGDFLVILFFHFGDEFVLHVDLFFGHLLKVSFLFLNVFLDFEQLI